MLGCLAQFLVISFFRPSSSNKNGIPPGLYIKKSHYFPQPSFDTVPYHSIADAFTDLKPDTAMVQPVVQDPDHKQPVCRASALSVDLGVPFASGEAELTLHRQMPPVIPSGDDAL